MKNVIVGILVGAGLTVAITTLPSIAPWYSQAIYDCGIRLGSGVSDGTISGFTITGHKIGICVTYGAHHVSFIGEPKIIGARTGVDFQE